MKALAGKAIENVLPLAIGTILVLGVAYFILRKAIGAAADTTGGILSGNNALTDGTVYEGAGIAGTLGAATNVVTGGALEKAGDAVGGFFFDIFGDDYDPNAPIYTVKFPDGSMHAVDSNNLDWRDQFDYKGIRYKLGQLNGQYVATKVQV